MRVAVIGDLMLDVIVEPLDALRPGDDTPGRISVRCGGQAANVAAWVAALGARARLVCVRASGEAGARAADELEARGVELVGPVLDGRGGVVVSVIASDGQRSLVSDPAGSRALRAEHLSPEWFSDCDWLHVSGYHLFDDATEAACGRAAELARRGGARVSLDLAYAARLRELGPDEARRRVQALAPDVVFHTAEEGAALGAPAPAPVCVVKRGADGCTVRAGERADELAARPGAVRDTTGAGDALAAGFLVSAGADPGTGEPVAAAGAGLVAAARCVAVVGAMPVLEGIGAG